MAAFVKVFISLDIAVMLWMLIALRCSIALFVDWTNYRVLMPVHISHWTIKVFTIMILRVVMVGIRIVLILSFPFNRLFALLINFFLTNVFVFITFFILIFIFMPLLNIMLYFPLFIFFNLAGNRANRLPSEMRRFLSSSKFMISCLKAT